MLAIRLPEEIENRLSELAARTGRTKTYYARQAILEKLEEMEDYYFAASRYEEHLKSEKQGIPSAEMRRRLGLDN